MLDTTGLFNPLESAAHKLYRLMQTVEKKVHKELNVMSPGIITAVNPAKSGVIVEN